MADFKVRCTRSRDNRFDVGKVYEINQYGQIIGDTADNLGRQSVGSFEEWCKASRWEDYSFEKVEEPKMFTKSDLRTGDWLVKRNGTVEQVFLGTEFGDFSCNSSGYHNEMDVRNNNLTSKMNYEFDIIRVIRPTKITHFSEQYHDEGEVVFDREKGIGCESPTKEISVSEAEKALIEKYGENVKIVAGK